VAKQGIMFIRGMGGFESKRGPSRAINTSPDRKPTEWF